MIVLSQYYLVESILFEGTQEDFKRAWDSIARSPIRPCNQEELRLWLNQCAIQNNLREMRDK